MTRTDFRDKWGAQWTALIAGPMWQDAVATADAEIKLFQVANIPDEEIVRHGHLRLKGMQAQAKFESTLATLAEKPFEFAQLEQTHPDPVEEANREAQRQEALSHPKKTRRKKTP